MSYQTSTENIALTLQNDSELYTLHNDNTTTLFFDHAMTLIKQHHKGAPLGNVLEAIQDTIAYWEDDI